MSLETTDCNNNALNHCQQAHTLESEPSEGLYFQDQMPEHTGCQPPKGKTRSISSLDRRMIRYFKSMLPVLPLKYVHFCSPKRRIQPHVLHSKMRLWHYGRKEPVSHGIPEQTACTSNASCSTRDDKTRYSFWTQSCSCCCYQLDTRPEYSIVHMATASDLPVATVIATRVQTARRIQCLDSVQGCLTQADPHLSPPLSQPSLVHASGKLRNSRRKVGKQPPSVIGFTGEGRVEVLPLLTAQQAPQHEENTYRQSVGDAMLPASSTPPVESTIISDVPLRRQFCHARPGLPQPMTEGGRSTGIISSSSSNSSSSILSYRPVTMLCDQEASIRPSDMSYSSTHASGSGDCIWGSRSQELLVAPPHLNRGVENAVAAVRKLPDRVVRQEAWNDCQRMLSSSSSTSSN